MSESRCNKFSFMHIDGARGFLAFDENGRSVGFDEVCSHIDGLQKQVEVLREACEFHADTKDYTDRGYHGVWCSHADDYSDAMGRLISDDGNRAKAALEKIKEIGV